MAKAKKQEKTIEQRLEEALVLYEKTPYELPSNWCWTTFEQIANLYTGNSINEREKELKYTGLSEGYNYIATKDIGFDYEIEYENGIKIPYEETRFKKARKGASLLCIEGGSAGRKLGFLQEEVCFVNKLCCFDFHGLVDKLYFYYLQSNEFFNLFNANKVGLIGGVSVSNLKQIAVPLAPLEEQKRIVEIIEKQFAKLDEARDLIQKSLDSFADRKSAILHKAFTGELTKQWRENNIIDNVYQIASSLGISEIQQTSCGWLKVKSENACSAKISCGHTPTKDILSFGEIPFLKVYNIVDNMIDFEYKPQFINSDTNNKLKSSELKPDDVIMNIVGPPLRKIALIPETYNVWNMNQAIVRFRAKEYILPKFIYYMLIWPNTLDDVVSKTKGVVGQANISVTQSRNLDFVIPSRQEQEEIVRILDSIFEKEDKSKELIDILDKIDEMKKTILARAFRGELGTSNPTDEPATDLLRKILEQSN